MYLLSISLLLSIILVSCTASFINEKVRRVIDVSSTISISRTTIRMKNIANTPASFFYLSVKSTDAEGLGDFWVTDSSANPMKALPMESSTDVPGLQPCCSGFKVSLTKPVPAGGHITVDVRMDVSGVIKPVPEVIEGYDAQHMRYVGSTYFFSPYKTEEMTTNIALGSSSVTSKHGLLEPFEVSGKKITMGPYMDVGALSYSEISVRFKNNRGFLVASHALKEFYVNHVGNIAVKEEFKVRNGGAKHAGEWSRVDHGQGMRSKYGAVLGDVWANLPADATGVIYKDLIGNITSSKLREPSKGKRAVQLVYRYPLMGGWQNHFWITYELMLSKYVTSKGSDHVMEIPLFSSLDTDLLAEEYEIKVYLPEWSNGIEVVPHPSLKLSEARTSERTTLTIYGRPVVTVGAKMLRSQSKHAKKLTIKYKYNPIFAYIIPAFISLELVSLFIVFVMCARSGLLGAEESEIALAKLKAQ